MGVSGPGERGLQDRNGSDEYAGTRELMEGGLLGMATGVSSTEVIPDHRTHILQRAPRDGHWGIVDGRALVILWPPSRLS